MFTVGHRICLAAYATTYFRGAPKVSPYNEIMNRCLFVRTPFHPQEYHRRTFFSGKEENSYKKVVNQWQQRELREKILKNQVLPKEILKDQQFDALDVPHCLTYENAELIVKSLRLSPQMQSELLIANAIVRNDCDDVLRILKANKIENNDFKKFKIWICTPTPEYWFGTPISFTPLYFALKNKNFQMVKLLIERGFSPYEKFKIIHPAYYSSPTPISHAIETGAQDIVSYLVSRGVQKKIENDIKYYGITNCGPYFKFTYRTEEFRKIEFNVKGSNEEETPIISIDIHYPHISKLQTIDIALSPDLETQFEINQTNFYLRQYTDPDLFDEIEPIF